MTRARAFLSFLPGRGVKSTPEAERGVVPHSIMVFHIEDAGNVFASAQGTGREGGRAASFSSRQDAPVFERGDRRPLMKRKRRKKHMLLPPFRRPGRITLPGGIRGRASVRCVSRGGDGVRGVRRDPHGHRDDRGRLRRAERGRGGRCPRASIRCPVLRGGRPCGWHGCGRR